MTCQKVSCLFVWAYSAVFDCIFSNKYEKIYASLDCCKEKGGEYYYSGLLVEQNFPDRLLFLINEYNDLVSGMVLSLLDEVEEEIYGYDLMLKNSGARLFNLSFEEGNRITFFTRYPTSQGFRDHYSE